MAPALLPGDRLLVARRAPRGRVTWSLAPDPRDPRRELVKRVSGLDAGSVTLRGDNPSESTDARTFGTLPRSAVRWRVIARYWPLDRIGRVPPRRPARAARGGRRARLRVSRGAHRRRTLTRRVGSRPAARRPPRRERLPIGPALVLRGKQAARHRLCRLTLDDARRAVDRAATDAHAHPRLDAQVADPVRTVPPTGEQ